MLTVEKLRKIATEAYENDEWICMVSGDVFTIAKLSCQHDIEEIVGGMDDIDYGDEEISVVDKDGTIYTEADHAKDWNYFKNTMGI